MLRRVLIAFTAALSIFAVSAASAEPVTLKVNYSAIPPHLIPAIFMKKDLIKHEGKSYKIKFVFTRGSAIVMQALAANEMDLGVLSSIASSKVMVIVPLGFTLDALAGGKLESTAGRS